MKSVKRDPDNVDVNIENGNIDDEVVSQGSVSNVETNHLSLAQESTEAVFN